MLLGERRYEPLTDDSYPCVAGSVDLPDNQPFAVDDHEGLSGYDKNLYLYSVSNPAFENCFLVRCADEKHFC